MQIAGLSAATVVTLLLVPVLYAIWVLDLRIMRWNAPHHASIEPEPHPTSPAQLAEAASPAA